MKRINRAVSSFKQFQMTRLANEETAKRDRERCGRDFEKGSGQERIIT